MKPLPHEAHLDLILLWSAPPARPCCCEGYPSPACALQPAISLISVTYRSQLHCITRSPQHLSQTPQPSDPLVNQQSSNHGSQLLVVLCCAPVSVLSEKRCVPCCEKTSFNFVSAPGLTSADSTIPHLSMTSVCLLPSGLSSAPHRSSVKLF